MVFLCVQQVVLSFGFNVVSRLKATPGCLPGCTSKHQAQLWPIRLRKDRILQTLSHIPSLCRCKQQQKNWRDDLFHREAPLEMRRKVTGSHLHILTTLAHTHTGQYKIHSHVGCSGMSQLALALSVETGHRAHGCPVSVFSIYLCSMLPSCMSLLSNFNQLHTLLNLP